MLISFVVAYLLVTVAVGLVAARRVHDSKDYLIAGRKLPLYMNVATVFATWFGAETVLAVSATFAKDGLKGIPGDPFGASVCLVLAALLFARLFYRMNLLTIGDFYRQRYGKGVEVLTSVAIVASYLGWTSAQMTALGLVIHVLSGGAYQPDGCDPHRRGGRAGLHDLRRHVVGGLHRPVADRRHPDRPDAGRVPRRRHGGRRVATSSRSAAADGKFEFFPAAGDAAAWWAMAGAFFAFAFGSIPQQDVFQRMTSAKDESTAVRGTIIGALVYFCFAFVPIFIAYSAIVADPAVAKLFEAEDARDDPADPARISCSRRCRSGRR